MRTSIFAIRLIVIYYELRQKKYDIILHNNIVSTIFVNIDIIVHG